jgi:SAM-dependent methyltransferase
MKKYLIPTDLLRKYLPTLHRTIIDVGCGNGDTVRWLASQGARVTGLDSPEMLAKARQVPPWGTEEYIEGEAQKLPFADKSADVILFQASFHHVPAEAMTAAALECRRVLKKNGRAVFIEPVYRAGAYTEITRLVGDEEEIQKKAQATIVSMARSGMTMEKEEFFFLERSFADYIHLLELHVDDAIDRAAILARARKITEKFSAAAGIDFVDFRYPSICRLNVLVKGGAVERSVQGVTQ